MAPYMKENLKAGSNVDMECINGLTGPCMKGTGKAINFTVKDFIGGQMEGSILVSGQIT